MDEIEFEEVLKEVCRGLNFSNVPGVNKECIKEYMKNLLTLNIDFQIIPIEWIVENTIGIISNNEIIDVNLLDVFVDKELFEDYMSESFCITNPVVYELVYQVASQVENKLVTFESRQEYYSQQLLKFKNQLEVSTNDSEKNENQFGVDFYTDLLEKINNQKNSKKR